jgi:hypothetical protein
MKKCTVCKLVKDDSLFDTFKQRNGTRSLTSRCKACRSEIQKAEYRNDKQKIRDRNRKWELKQYGITPEQFQTMFENQNGKCELCGGTNPEGGLCVDHNHSTGEVRKLLCRSCNLMIGNARESIDILINAATYLENFQETKG